MKNVMKMFALMLVLVILGTAMTSCALLPEGLIELPEWNFTGLDPLLTWIFGDSLNGTYQNESGTIRYEFNGDNVSVILFQEEYEAILEGTGMTYEGELWLGDVFQTTNGDSITKFETTLPDGAVIQGEANQGSNVILVNPDGSFVYDSENGTITKDNDIKDKIYIYNSSAALSRVMILQGTYEIDDGEIVLKLHTPEDPAISYVALFLAGIYSFEEGDDGEIYIGSDKLISVN